MLSDLRLAFRQFAKSPGFAAVIVLTLALGIGFTTAIFSVVNAAYLRPLPFPDAGRLVYLSERNEQWNDMGASYPNFLDWRARQDVFSALTLFRFDGRKLQTAAGAEQVEIAQVSADFFPAVGLHAAQGRDLAPADDRVGAAPVLWLSDAAWRRHFAGARDPVGRTILLDGQPTTVAGILPAGFRFLRAADVYVPVEPFVDQQFMRERPNHNSTQVIGRLKPGVTLGAARTELTEINRQLVAEHPKDNAGLQVNVLSLRERMAGWARTGLLLLLAAVGLLLTIACVNIANMLLARSSGRGREMAIRVSVGATRGVLMRQLLLESLVLAGAGGAVGAFVGAWGYSLVARLVPWEMQAAVAGTNAFTGGVLLFVTGITLATGTAFGLAPAWQLSHTNPIAALKSGGAAGRIHRGRFSLADGLVVAQTALALMLLVGAGLLIRSLARVVAVETGIQPEHVLTLRVAAPPQEAVQRDPRGYATYHERILAAVQALPEVGSAAFVSGLPYTWNTSNNMFFRTDQPPPVPGRFPVASVHVITEDYFRTLGIPLVRGQTFDGHEPIPSLPTNEPINLAVISRVYANFEVSTVISQSMADRIWPKEDPIGKSIQMGQPEMNLPRFRVIGVVGDTTQLGAERGIFPEYYCALRQWPAPMPLHLVVRTRGDPAGVLGSVRTAVRAAAPGEPIFDVELMTDRIADFSSDRRFNMGLFTFFAGTALLLASIGIYGVLACVVGQRTREIGIRMALGAQRRDVLRGVLARGLRLAGLGAALGLAGAWGVSRLLQSQLFGVTGTDTPTYAAGALLVLAAAFLACWMPARRATRVDPIDALRAE